MATKIIKNSTKNSNNTKNEGKADKASLFSVLAKGAFAVKHVLLFSNVGLDGKLAWSGHGEIQDKYLRGLAECGEQVLAASLAGGKEVFFIALGKNGAKSGIGARYFAFRATVKGDFYSRNDADKNKFERDNIVKGRLSLAKASYSEFHALSAAQALKMGNDLLKKYGKKAMDSKSFAACGITLA